VPTYRAISFTGIEGSPDVVLTACPAYEIEEWSGVPQRELIDGQETIGFQREENAKRLAQIAAFFSDPSNVAQNPLLCAARSLEEVCFVPDAGQHELSVRVGYLEIHEPDLDGLPLSELFARLEASLRGRQPALAMAEVSSAKIQALQERLQDEHGIALLDEIDERTVADDADSDEVEPDDSLELFASETHVLEFWQEVKVRQMLLEGLEAEVRESLEDSDSFLGFSRDVLCSFLKPVLLVDGQHRLLGALKAASERSAHFADSDSFLEQVAEGRDAEELAEDEFRAACRLLPVSMLMSSDVAEHVFQFVVVNQKATPVGKALLGTIVATSLTEDELATVSDRLEQVQINVTDSRAVAWFTRDPQSAFKGKVQQGLEAEGNDKLPWTVLRELLSMFRTLSGGRLPSAPRNDYADLWRRRYLAESDLVADALDGVPPEDALKTATEHWQQVDGPWRGVANAFFEAVRDRLGDPSNMVAPNAWGSTASNLYNKVTLSILVADFFQYLTDSGKSIMSADDCKALVSDWLNEVDVAYFNRDWNLSGVKKDNPGIRKKWSEMWVDYRKDPSRLPNVRGYRNAST
jgi:hypothetical protein